MEHPIGNLMDTTMKKIKEVKNFKKFQKNPSNFPSNR